MRRTTLGIILVGAVALGAGAFFLWRHPSRSMKQIGTMNYPSLDESSGIVASRRHLGVYWTHNDQGNAPALFAITREGVLIAEVRVDDKNDDWEDIAIDDEGRLYIGEIGNEGRRKDELEVLRVVEPDPRIKSRGKYRRVSVDKRWRLKFSGAPFDSESLFVWRGWGYVISKTNKGKPAVMYRFPLDEQKEVVVLEVVATLPIRSPVTAADLSPDGARLAVLSTAALHIFRIDGDPAKAASVRSIHYPITGPDDLEGCCFAPGGVLATAESRGIYLFPD